MSKTDLILESLKEIKSDINQLKTDVKDIKTRLDIIESLPTIKKELVR